MENGCHPLDALAGAAKGGINMREILFRGKRKDNEEWSEGCLIRDEFCNTDIPYIGYLSDYDIGAVEVYPETVGQFTGLTDKNDKKIFEGDIVKNEYEDGKHQNFKIFYNVKTLQWEVMNKYGMRGILRNVIGNMEVIGNIHDNPELLGVTE